MGVLARVQSATSESWSNLTREPDAMESFINSFCEYIVFESWILYFLYTRASKRMIYIYIYIRSIARNWKIIDLFGANNACEKHCFIFRWFVYRITFAAQMFFKRCAAFNFSTFDSFIFYTFDLLIESSIERKREKKNNIVKGISICIICFIYNE